MEENKVGDEEVKGNGFWWDFFTPMLIAFIIDVLLDGIIVGSSFYYFYWGYAIVFSFNHARKLN